MDAHNVFVKSIITNRFGEEIFEHSLLNHLLSQEGALAGPSAFWDALEKYTDLNGCLEQLQDENDSSESADSDSVIYSAVEDIVFYKERMRDMMRGWITPEGFDIQKEVEMIKQWNEEVMKQYAGER